MCALSGCKIFNDVDTQMVTVNLQCECLLEMNELLMIQKYYISI